MLIFEIIGIGVLLYGIGFLILLCFVNCDLRLAFYEKLGRSLSRLQGNVVFIVGASSGIGEQTAITLAKNGVKLILAARRQEELERVKEQCLTSSGGKLTTNDILVIRMDILDIYSHKKYFDQALRHFGHIDVLFNNTGRGQRGVFEIIESSVDKQVFDLNVFSIVHLSRVAVNYFINRGVGHIAATSSLGGITGMPYASTAAASKAALSGYFKSLRAELVGKNIAISLICPGPVSTNYEEKSFTDRAGEIYGVQATGKMVGTARCGKLCAVTFANRLDEVWISKFHHLFMTYMAVYFPLVYNAILNIVGPDKMFKTYAPIEATNNINRARNI